MKRVTLIATAVVLAVLVGMSARVAAQNPVANERTIMTFSNTVELPGVTLPAGTYVFRLADTPSRNVVQVLAGDEKDILGQWTFAQASRPQATGDTVVMFKESPEGTTPAVQYWYYPGERIGKEFIYPKDQAQKIANRLGAQVLSDDGRVSPTVTSTDAKGQTTEWQRDQANTTAANAASADNSSSAASADAAPSSTSTLREAPAPAQPTAAAGSLTGNRGVPAVPEAGSSNSSATLSADASQNQANQSRAVGTTGTADAQAPSTSRQPESTQARAAELPRTASPAPLVGLIGLLSLAGALGARRFASARV